MSKSITQAEIEELKSLLGAMDGVDWERDAASIREADYGRSIVECVFTDEDLAFILAARKAVPGLLAKLELLRKQKSHLREQISFIVRHSEQRAKLIDAPEDSLIGELCERIGYGAVMDSASRLWLKKDPHGAFVIGGAMGTLTSLLKRTRRSS